MTRRRNDLHPTKPKHNLGKRTFKYAGTICINALLAFIIWLVFVADITRALIGEVQLNGRALFSRNAHGPITDYAN